MAYKDKDKQREANRERQRRYKARSKALSKGVTSEGVTKGVTVTGEEVVIPLEYQRGGGFVVPDKLGPLKPKQGSTDTLGTEAESLQHKSGTDTMSVKTVKFPTHKRGKDIKCFEDLSKGVQETINQMCRIDDNRIDATAKANRTAIAINYQHQFPDRYHSTGVV